MKFPVLTKSRVGFSIALVGVLTLVGVEAGRHAFLLQGRLATSCVILGMLGLLFWLIGQWKRSRRDEAADHPLAFLKSLRYWGFIVSGSAILIYSVTPQPAPVVARPAPPVVKPVEPVKPPPLTNAAFEVNEPLAVVFPDLKLQGLVYNGENSSAVINGKTLRVGRHIGEVKLVAIAARAVTVELSGEQRVLHLGE